jgi:hypothetical protein
MSKNLVPFGDFDEREAAKIEKELDEGSKSIFKFPEGSTVLRIVPPPPGRKSPWVETYQHFIPVPGQEKPMVFNCPRKLDQGRKCPACERAFELYKSGNAMDKEAAKRFWPKQKFYLPVIIRAKKGEDIDNTIRIIAVGRQICGQIVEIRKGYPDPEDPETMVLPRDVTHPIEGWDLVVKRTGTSQQDTKYTVRVKKNGQVPLFYKVGDDGSIKADYTAINETLSNPVNLDAQIELPTDERIKKLMIGDVGENKQLSSGNERRGRTASDDVDDEGRDDDEAFPGDDE